MIFNEHCQNENMDLQHSYDDIVDVIVGLCSIHYSFIFLEGSKFATYDVMREERMRVMAIYPLLTKMGESDRKDEPGGKGRKKGYI